VADPPNFPISFPPPLFVLIRISGVETARLPDLPFQSPQTFFLSILTACAVLKIFATTSTLLPFEEFLPTTISPFLICDAGAYPSSTAIWELKVGAHLISPLPLVPGPVYDTRLVFPPPPSFPCFGFYRARSDKVPKSPPRCRCVIWRRFGCSVSLLKYHPCCSPYCCIRPRLTSFPCPPCCSPLPFMVADVRALR